jgi:hypothetical protein
MIVMADPVSISAFCGVLLHNNSTKIGSYVVEDDFVVDVNSADDDFGTPQGSSPSTDPLTRKNDAVDNHVFGDLIVRI